MVQEVLYTALFSGFAAATTSLTFYFKKAAKKKNINLDFGKIGQAVILAAIVGAAGSYFGLSEDFIVASPLYAMAGLLLNNLYKTISGRFF